MTLSPRSFLLLPAVPVRGAYAILPAISELVSLRGRTFDAVVATQDWHPPDHISFATSHPGKHLFDTVEQPPARAERSENPDGEGAENGKGSAARDASIGIDSATGARPSSRAPSLLVTLFRPHCVAGTPGASLVPPLDAAAMDAVFRKGQLSSVESYSGFFDLGGTHDTGLNAYLTARGTRLLAIAGVATDYCVFATARDALKAGYDVILVRDAVAGVDPEASAAKVAELERLGAEVVSARDVESVVARKLT